MTHRRDTAPAIGGGLDMAALAALGGAEAAADARMAAFHALTREEQAEAIRRMAASGQGEHTIAHATRLSVELIRRVLAKAVSDG